MAIAFTDGTKNPLLVVQGATIKPFAALNVTDTVGLTQNVLVEWADSTQMLPTTAIGTFADPNGGGTTTMITPNILEFSESGLVTGDPTFATQLFQRLTFTAPTLTAGKFVQIIDAFSVVDSDNTFVSETIPLTPLIDVITPPAIGGTVAHQPTGVSTSIKPFATTTITDGDFGAAAQDVASITITDSTGKATDDLGLLTGAGLQKNGVGSYILPNLASPVTLQSELQALTFAVPAGFGTTTVNFELAVQDVPPASIGGTPPPGVDLATALTTKDIVTSVDEIGPPPPPPTANFHVLDTTTGVVFDTVGAAFTGPVPGIKNQLIINDTGNTTIKDTAGADHIIVSTDNLNVTAVTADVFIHTAQGKDAIDVSGVNGTNVLDGGSGSNFLTGGSGAGLDTFFLDDRNTTVDIFDTVRNLHSGDAVTFFGITQAGFTITAGDNVLPGVPGLDIAVTAPGKPNANLDLPDFTKADLSNGKLVQSFGRTPDLPGLPGSDFMIITAT